MRASHVALLSLAASTAAPVFAAPLSYFNARSKGAGAALSARGSRDDCTKGTSKNHAPQSHSDNPAGSENHTPQSHSDNSKGLFDRDSVDEFITAIANMKTRRSDVEQGAHARGSSENAFGVVERDVPRDGTPESLAAGVTTEDFAAAMLNDRGLSSGQDIQARGLFSLGMGVLSQFFRRDVDPELLAARDGVEDFVNSIISRDDSNPEQMQARDEFAQVLKALASRRDAEADGLAARSNWEDFVGMLKSRDTVDDILGAYFSNHATREPSPEQETQARGIPDGPKIVARDGSAANDFKALLNSRDSLKGELAGRDYTYGNFLDDYMSSHATREPSPEQETQARGIPDSPKIVARDGSATDAFIKALYNTRISSKREELTAEDVLSLASLASRALDDLD